MLNSMNDNRMNFHWKYAQAQTHFYSNTAIHTCTATKFSRHTKKPIFLTNFFFSSILLQSSVWSQFSIFLFSKCTFLIVGLAVAVVVVLFAIAHSKIDNKLNEFFHTTDLLTLFFALSLRIQYEDRMWIQQKKRSAVGLLFAVLFFLSLKLN